MVKSIFTVQHYSKRQDDDEETETEEDHIHHQELDQEQNKLTEQHRKAIRARNGLWVILLQFIGVFFLLSRISLVRVKGNGYKGSIRKKQATPASVVETFSTVEADSVEPDHDLSDITSAIAAYDVSKAVERISDQAQIATSEMTSDTMESGNSNAIDKTSDQVEPMTSNEVKNVETTNEASPSPTVTTSGEGKTEALVEAASLENDESWTPEERACRHLPHSSDAFARALQNDIQHLSLPNWTSPDQQWKFQRMDSDLINAAFGNKRVAFLGDSTLFYMQEWMAPFLNQTNPNFLGPIADTYTLTEAEALILFDSGTHGTSRVGLTWHRIHPIP